MIVAVASGKGGTGKTTVASNLAKRAGQGTLLLDCDVEEPNAHLFFQSSKKLESEEVTLLIPEVDESLCTGCGECSKFCEFSALAVLDKNVLVFPELCHGCGGCTLVCPEKAISEIPKKIGVVEVLDVSGFRLVRGVLDVGVAMAPPLIDAVKKHVGRAERTIIDAPPGTSCPMVATVRGMDYLIFVTEPTPFGLHDLKLAVAVAEELELPFGVVINRSDGGDERTREFCNERGVKILAELPEDLRIAEAYSEGRLIVDALPEYAPVFDELLKVVEEQTAQVSGRGDQGEHDEA